MKCNNCGKNLSCGCKKRVAKDGTSCCSSCVTVYNNKLVAEGKLKPSSDNKG
jgi:hypothetical protein